MLLARIAGSITQKVFVFYRPRVVPEVIETAIPEDDARISRCRGLVDQRTAFGGILVVDVVAVMPIPEFRLSRRWFDNGVG